jgi:hypothetical protein
MITPFTTSLSHDLSFDQVLARLKASPAVDGIAEFGSRAVEQTDPVSDYDLLLLVNKVPARVFQLVTSIGGRLADVVLVKTETSDALLTAQEPPAPRSFEGLFLQKMQTARILYDASGRLQRVQKRVIHSVHDTKQAAAPDDAQLYSIWFWQSFGMLHMDRMAASSNPLHLTAVDMMLTSCLPATWRSYFELRGIPWQGEKAAVRYWTEHDSDYLATVQNTLASSERTARLDAYRALVRKTLEPIAAPFQKGDTAVLLAQPQDTIENVERMLDYWDALLRA